MTPSWSRPSTPDLISTGTCIHERCGLEVVLPRGYAERCWETGELFWCPAGHSQHYDPHKREAEAKLKREKAAAEKEAEQAREREAAAKLAKDRVARTCPWPTCDGRMLASPRGLRQHMVKAHGAPWAMPEVTADEVGQVLNGADPVDVVR